MHRRLLQSFVVAVAAATLTVAPRSAEAQCSLGYTFTAWAGGASCYRLTTRTLTWDAAVQQATDFGGWLATLNTSVENTAARGFVNGTVAGNTSVFIGYNDIATENVFVWQNGEATHGFSNWSSGEPNNVGNEDATELLTNGAWNDLPTGLERYGLIESAVTSTVPEPSTYALLGSGLAFLGLVARRRRR
ncbi:MAG: lectin-like protein [Gemmatirosa sp.]